MAGVFYFPLIGTPTAEGNKLFFYEAGLDVPLDVFSDSDLTLPFSQPIILNAAGESDGPIYVSPDISQKVVYTDANGIAIPGYPVDFVSPSTIVNVMTSAIVTLTDAQIKALPTTPVLLLAAPAAGLRTKLFGASIRAVIVSNYTNLNASYCDIDLAYSASGPLLGIPIFNQSGTTPTVATGLTSLFAAGAGTRVVDVVVAYAELAGKWPSAPGQLTSVEAALPVYLKGDNNGSGAWTGGNAANTLTVVLYYALESVA